MNNDINDHVSPMLHGCGCEYRIWYSVDAVICQFKKKDSDVGIYNISYIKLKINKYTIYVNDYNTYVKPIIDIIGEMMW
jgi:hypothetical protein